MGLSKIEGLVDSWASKDEGVGYRDINKYVRYLAQRLYHDYEPTEASTTDFMIRLEKWLDNVSTDEEKQVLFRLLPRIFYAGEREFRSLYRVAYNEIISRWIIDTGGVRLTDLNNAKNELHRIISETWICPITESMRINSFYHINYLTGFSYRPDWRSIKRFGSEDKVREFCNQNGIKRLVLLEDFVGSGSQITDVVEFASGLDLFDQILVIPLIICPEGMDNLNRDLSVYTEVRVQPVLSLSHHSFVRPSIVSGEEALAGEVRKLANDTYHPLLKPPATGAPFGPFGYRMTGGLLVMYSNTPDNSLPVIHWRSDEWYPIFERHTR